MPFITEEIFQALPRQAGGAETRFLMTSRWPEYQQSLCFPAEEAAIEAVMDTIKAIRARRSEMNVPPSRKAEVLLVTASPEIYTQGLHFIQRLAYASEISFAEAAPTDLSGQVLSLIHIYATISRAFPLKKPQEWMYSPTSFGSASAKLSSVGKRL